MKLELKHLAPYLPYKLKIRCGEISHPILTCADTNEFEIAIKEVFINNAYKLILRPLSDLTKEIEVNGKKTIPCNLIFPCDSLDNDFGIFSYQYAETLQKEKLNCCLDYNQWSLLFEWHFDVFGLIEKGLAIDINSLAQSSE